jgi:hypothetical protein
MKKKYIEYIYHGIDEEGKLTNIDNLLSDLRDRINTMNFMGDEMCSKQEHQQFIDQFNIQNEKLIEQSRIIDLIHHDLIKLNLKLDQLTLGGSKIDQLLREIEQGFYKVNTEVK